MSEVRNAIEVAAPPERIYVFACATPDWPRYLPHYRFVRRLRGDAAHGVVEMAARRGWIPVRWRAEQWNDARTPEIRFHHLAGWTRGMDVVWRFERVPGGTRVSIDHTLPERFPFTLRIARWIAGQFFIDNVARRTLSCMKRLAESDEP